MGIKSAQSNLGLFWRAFEQRGCRAYLSNTFTQPAYVLYLRGIGYSHQKKYSKCTLYRGYKKKLPDEVFISPVFHAVAPCKKYQMFIFLSLGFYALFLLSDY
jgi:hypothetical protein